MSVSDVTAATAGDRRAFERLVEAHRHAVCAITIAILGDPGSGEDVAQEVFVIAWRTLPRLRAPDRFRPWLHRIARNQARLHARTARRAGARVGPEAVPGPDAEQLLADAQEAERVRAALEALPVDVREVLVLYYREDLSTAEVARQLELSDAAVRQRLVRARALAEERRCGVRRSAVDRRGDRGRGGGGRSVGRRRGAVAGVARIGIRRAPVPTGPARGCAARDVRPGAGPHGGAGPRPRGGGDRGCRGGGVAGDGAL